MQHVRFWDQPVRVGDELIFSPLQAYQFVRDNWANRKDPQFTIAYNAIPAALEGKITPDEARIEFEAALNTAHSI